MPKVIALDHLDVVKLAADHVIGMIQHATITRDDLRSEGYLALVEVEAAARSVDDPRAYAYRAVRLAMLRFCRRERVHRERWGGEFDERRESTGGTL
jgi:DNA-directed RNA polymerase specialized sigma24 family protein